jgi:hypothetical protein
MTAQRIAVWRRVLAALPLLLVVAAVPEHALLRCRMDGEMRAACCCTTGAAPAGPSVSNPCCCDRVVVSGPVAPFTSARDAAPVIQVAIPVVLPAYVARVAPEPVVPPRAVHGGGPARERPPLLILKQTFLI